MISDAEAEWTHEDDLLLELHSSAARLRRFGRVFEVAALVGSIVLAVALFAGIVVGAIEVPDQTKRVGLVVVGIPTAFGLTYLVYVSTAVVGTFCRTYALARLLEVERS